MSLYLIIRIRNVRKTHLEEIFSTYGEVKEVYFQVDRKGAVSKTCASVIFRKEKDAEQAMFYLDGGQIDGNVIKISYILVSNSKRKRDLSGTSKLMTFLQPF